MSTADTLILDYTEFAEKGREFRHEMDNVRKQSHRSNEHLGARGIQSFIADGRVKGEGPTVIVPRAFHAHELDGFEDQRDTVLAVALGARVVGIDTPGVGLWTDPKTTLAHKVAAIRGSMQWHTASQMAVIREIIQYDDQEPLSFIGFSMGAWAVAEMVCLPDAPKIGRIDLVEAVNDQPWRLLGKNGLKAKMGSEDQVTNHYLSQNVPLFNQPYDRNPNDYTRVAKHVPLARESLMLGYGMRKPFAPVLTYGVEKDNVYKTSGLGEAPIHFWRADGSGVARDEANKKTVEAISRFNKEARLTVLQHVLPAFCHRHPMWHSMPTVAVLAAAMREAAQ